MTKEKKHFPLRNKSGRFITKHFVNSESEGAHKAMKTITMKGKKFKRASLDSPRIGKKTSVVWNFFKSLPHDNGISRAVCLLCKVIFKNPGGSTTGMRGHLERKHPGVIDRLLLPVKIEKTEPKRSNSPPPPHLSIENGAIATVGETEMYEQDSSSVMIENDHDQGTPVAANTRRKKRILPGPPPEVYSETNEDDLTKSVVMHLVSSMLPVHHVEGAFYKRLFNLNSVFELERGSLDEDTNNDSILPPVISVLDDLYKEAKEHIKGKLQDKAISVSLELWLKSNIEVYVLVTANFVNREWALESYFLGMRLLPETCFLTVPEIVTEKVSQVVGTLLEEYEIKTENVFHVLAHSVPLALSANILNVTTWPCLNDLIQRCYELLNSFAVSITDCDVVNNSLKIAKQVLPNYKDLKRHPGKLMESMKAFLTTHTAENLPLKVEDLEECIRLQEPFGVIIESLLEFQILPASTITPLIFLVRNMYDSQANTDSTPSTNWPKEQRQEVTTSISSQIESSYKLNLASRDLGDPMLAVCTFLDPRYKKLKFLTEEQRNFVYDTVTELLHEQGKDKNQSGNTGSIISVRSENPTYTNGVVGNSTDPLNTSAVPSSSTQPEPTQANNSRSTKLSAMLSSVIDRPLVKVPSAESMEELNNYWETPTAPLDMDPYQWWCYNHERYPKLGEIAKRYLCIPANATSARLSFTGARKKYYDDLANIEPEYVEKLQVLRHYHSLHTELNDKVPQFSHLGLDEQVNIKSEAVESMDIVELMDDNV